MEKWTILKLEKRTCYYDKQTGVPVPFNSEIVVYDITIKSEKGQTEKRGISNRDYQKLFNLIESGKIKVGDTLKGQMKKYTGYEIFMPAKIIDD